MNLEPLSLLMLDTTSNATKKDMKVRLGNAETPNPMIDPDAQGR
jgi:hypothetical protein